MMNTDQNPIDIFYELYYSFGDERKELMKKFNTNEKISNLLNGIFKYGYIFKIKDYILDFRRIFKDYIFSPIQQLYEEISKNTGVRKQYWNNSWMSRKLEDIGYNLNNNLNNEELDEIILAYDLSNRAGNYDIYALSNTIIDDYNINLLWINLMPQSKKFNTLSQYIFDDDVVDKFAKNISKWRQLNPKNTINLWCDSGLVNERSLRNTIKLLEKYNINFMDIRVIPNIPSLVYKSLHPVTPVYHRVDLSKILLTDYLTNPKYNENRYVVYTDIDVEPMNSDHLFDFITFNNLEKYGYVFNNVGVSTFENSFFIFDSENKSSRINRNIIETIENDFQSTVNGVKEYPWYSSTIIYDEYYPLALKNEGERRNEDKRRKPVNVPPSQFNFGPDGDLDDHRRESFSFNRYGNLETKYGRKLTLTYLEYHELYEFDPIPLT